MDSTSSRERVPEPPIGLGAGGRGASPGDPGASEEQGPVEPIELNRAQSEANLEAIRNVRLAAGARWLVLPAVLVVLAIIAVLVF